MRTPSPHRHIHTYTHKQTNTNIHTQTYMWHKNTEKARKARPGWLTSRVYKSVEFSFVCSGWSNHFKFSFEKMYLIIAHAVSSHRRWISAVCGAPPRDGREKAQWFACDEKPWGWSGSDSSDGKSELDGELEVSDFPRHRLQRRSTSAYLISSLGREPAGFRWREQKWLGYCTCGLY